MMSIQLWQVELCLGVHEVYWWNGLDGMSYGRAIHCLADRSSEKARRLCPQHSVELYGWSHLSASREASRL